MAYEKQTWKTGEVITEEKLNHMEEGIANGGGTLLVNVSSHEEGDNTTVYTLDKTWNEIKDALVSGKYICCVEENDTNITTWVQNIINAVFYTGEQTSSPEYAVRLFVNGDDREFSSSTADGVLTCVDSTLSTK